jgi:hypothetical protein
MKNLKFLLLAITSLLIFSSCEKELSLETGAGAAGLATGTLKDVLGNCNPSTINGIYKTDSTLTDSNYVNIQINFATTGSYKIKTDTVNGFYLVDSGFVNSTGLKTIKLKAKGKPILPIITDFSVTFSSSFCLLSIPVIGSGSGGGGINPNLSDTAWMFSEGTTNFNGPIDSAVVMNILGINFLAIEGVTKATGDSTLIIAIALPTPTIQTGTYLTSTGASLLDFSDALGATIYEADNTVVGANVTIIITSYNSTTKIVEGTYSGTVNKVGTGIVTLSNGKFKAKVK